MDNYGQLNKHVKKTVFMVESAMKTTEKCRKQQLRTELLSAVIWQCGTSPEISILQNQLRWVKN